MITKAAVARHSGAPLTIETLAIGEPGEGEVLVRLVASGVSHADLEAIGDTRSPFPFVPGGEGAGLVERIGAAVTSVAPGDAVVLLRAARPRPGEYHPFRDDGAPIAGLRHAAFATHALCRADALAPVAGDAPLELLAGLGDDIRAAAAAVLRHFEGPEGTVVVAGAGAAGLVAIMAARARGATAIIAADPDASRRALASDVGATFTVHTDEDLAAVVHSLTGNGARLTLETTGHADTLAACLRATAPGGTCGSLKPPAEPLDALDLSRETDAAETLATLVGWHAEGRLPIEGLISFFPFEHVNDALAALTAGAAIKPVIRFSIGPFADLDRAGTEGAAVEALDEGPLQPSDPELERAPTAVLEPE